MRNARNLLAFQLPVMSRKTAATRAVLTSTSLGRVESCIRLGHDHGAGAQILALLKELLNQLDGRWKAFEEIDDRISVEQVERHAQGHP